MALSLSVTKVDETPDYCLYDFGTEDIAAGRAKLDKDSGDVELVDLSETEAPARAPFFLAQVVPRLHRYHDRDAYPSHDSWDA